MLSVNLATASKDNQFAVGGAQFDLDNEKAYEALKALCEDIDFSDR